MCHHNLQHIVKKAKKLAKYRDISSSTQLIDTIYLEKRVDYLSRTTYIADANKQEKVFEQKLHEASKELSASLPFYQSRRKAVLDSTIVLTKQYQAGQLNTQLKTLPTGIQYYVVKENGSVKPVQKNVFGFIMLRLFEIATKRLIHTIIYQNQQILLNLR